MRAAAWFFVALASALVLPSAFADSTNKYWLLYEQGKTAADQKEFGKALHLYKEAIGGAGIFPEAEAAIGDVFMAEGEASLAQKQYEKAYNLRKSFYVPDDQYGILYKLANLFEIQQQYKQMEDSLNQIVGDDKRFQDTPNQKLRMQVRKNYLDKGIDRMLVLYNFEDSFSAAAHSKLGWFYYRTGRFDPSLQQLLYSVIYRVSQVERYRKEHDVDFEYSSLGELLQAIDADAELKSYASGSGLFKDLYYLAGSTFAFGFPSHAVIIWKLIASSEAAGQYRALAAKQLKKPFVEPLLQVTR